MTAVIRGDALHLPLANESVDLIITSPPYFALRSYRDGGSHFDGQIGSEPTPQAFLEALWAVTAELWRVLKPTGSLFVNLGDKRSGSGGHNNSGLAGSTAHTEGIRTMPRPGAATRRNAPDRYQQAAFGRPKSKMLLPHRYAIGCEDGLADPDGVGWIVRSDGVWHKANGLPESVTDRWRDSHEYIFHLTKQGRYFSAIDEIREQREWTPNANGSCPTCGLPTAAGNGKGGATNGATARPQQSGAAGRTGRTASVTSSTSAPSLLDSLSTTSAATEDASDPPTSSRSPDERTSAAPSFSSPIAPTATLSTTPTSTDALTAAPPASAAHAPSPVCACDTRLGALPGSVWKMASEPLVVPDWLGVDHFAAFPAELPRRLILGWSPSGICTACNEGRRPVVAKELVGVWHDKAPQDTRYEGQEGAHLNGRKAEGDPMMSTFGSTSATITGYACACPNTHAPTRPAVILDVFGGTGTVAMVARALGRTGISLDLSADYCRLAKWRIFDSGHASKARRRTNEEAQGAML